MVLMPRKNDHVAQLGGVELREIDRNNRAIRNKGSHALADNAHTADTLLVVAPVAGCHHPGDDRTAVNVGIVVSRLSSSRFDSEQWNGEILQFCNCGLRTLVGSRFAQSALQVASRQSCSLPEVPAIGISGESSHVDVIGGFRFVDRALPAGNRHWRNVEQTRKPSLIQVQTLTQAFDLCSPLWSSQPGTSAHMSS